MTTPDFRYPFRLREAFQDTRNNTELEIFLNTFVVKQDEDGNVTVAGTLDVSGEATLGSLASTVLTGDLDMDDHGIIDAVFVDIGRVHNYDAAGANITAVTLPYDLFSLTGGTLASGQVWHFTWGGYIETSVTSAGTWVLGLYSGADTQYGVSSRLTSTWHTGDNSGQGGTFGGSCIVATDDAEVKIVVTTRSVSGGTQLARGLYIVGLRLS